MRALIVTRLSRVTEATTSPERQREACERLCGDRGWTVAGVAEDLDVSGSVSPFERARLRPWLTEAPDVDVVVVYRIDRLTRSLRHLLDVMDWSERTGVSVVSATEPFDTSTAIGRLLPKIIAMVAELELEGISERNTNAAQYNLRAGKYRGGTAPAGYRAEKDAAGEWRLIPDDLDGLVVQPKPDTDDPIPDVPLAPVIRDVVARLLDGGRLASIVRDLNERAVPTQRDRQAVLNGRTSEGRLWSISNLRRLLESPTLIGRVVHRPVETDANGNPRKVNGKKVYGPEQVMLGEDTAPLVRATPLISEPDYRALQRLLAERGEENKQTKRAAETTLLLHVMFCGVCDRPMYRLKGGPGRQNRYRCASHQHGGSCGNRTTPIPQADDLVTRMLLATIGEWPHVEKQYDPGADQADELADVDARLQTLAESVTRFPAGSAALAGLLAQADALSARRAELAAMPTRSAGYRFVPTGATFSEHWASLDAAGKNDYLRSHAVRAVFTHRASDKPEWNIEFGEMITMLAGVDPDTAQALDKGGEEFKQRLDALMTQGSSQ